MPSRRTSSAGILRARALVREAHGILERELNSKLGKKGVTIRSIEPFIHVEEDARSCLKAIDRIIYKLG